MRAEWIARGSVPRPLGETVQVRDGLQNLLKGRSMSDWAAIEARGLAARKPFMVENGQVTTLEGAIERALNAAYERGVEVTRATDPPAGVFWAVSRIRALIGDNGRAMLSDLPAAVEAWGCAAEERGRQAGLAALRAALTPQPAPTATSAQPEIDP